MCLIRLPEDYDVVDIDPNSVLLEGEIRAESLRINGRVTMATFSRSALQESFDDLETLTKVELLVTGELTDGMPFEGTDTIRLIDKRNKNSLARGLVMRKIPTTILQPKAQIAHKIAKTANP
jgi:hypothetical protein